MEKLKIEVTYTSHEYADDYPTHVEIELSDAMKAKIKEAETFIGGDYAIEVRILENFNYYNDDEESNFRVGYSCLCISSGGRAYVYAQNKYDSAIYFESDVLTIN
jgi:hypothetical protein